MGGLDWHVGMKIVCADDSHPGVPGWPLVKHRIYVIDRLFMETAYYHGNSVGERSLVELRGVKNPCPVTCGFLASRFRPLRTRDADISVFTRMLAGEREHAPA